MGKEHNEAQQPSENNDRALIAGHILAALIADGILNRDTLETAIAHSFSIADKLMCKPIPSPLLTN